MYSKILRLFDFSLKMNGFPIEKAKAALSKIQDKDDFHNYIKERKKAIVLHHLENTSFYKSLGKSIN